MESRAAALEELEETGALDSVLAEGDSIDRELEKISSGREVETELETLKSEMGKGEGGGETSEAVETEEAAVEVDEEAVEEELAELEAEEEEQESQS